MQRAGREGFGMPPTVSRLSRRREPRPEVTWASPLWYASLMAPRFESIHLPHFLAEDAEVPARVRHLAAHYGDLVRFASQLQPGQAGQTPIPCRHRPGRRACRGLLVVEWQAAAKRVEWHCENCKACGVITGWQATQADLRAMRRAPRKDVREVVVTVEALAALRDIAREDPELGRLAFSAQVGTGGRAFLVVSESECERYGPRLMVEVLKAAGNRARGLLMTIVDALAGTQAEGDGGPGLVELHASDVADLLQRLFDLPDARPPEFVSTNARSRPVRMRPLRRPPPQTFQIKVTLRDVRPPIWRRLLVSSHILLPELHHVLQAAMGWHDCHLHLFRVGNRSYAPPGDWDPVGEDSRGVALVDLAAKQGARLVYEYDFGDGWTHDIVVESVLPEPCEVPRCTGGRRRCPPEDCGGPWGYAELLDAVRDRSHERHAELGEWLEEGFDPAEFDLDDTDGAVRSAGGK